MKKLYAIFGGIILFGIITIGLNGYFDIQIKNNYQIIRNHRSDERFWSSETQKLVIDENTLLIFGSSELRGLKDYEERISNFLNSPDMNVLTIGRGYYQSLSHTMALGSISDELPNKKVALFLSPQWFTPTGITQKEFPQKFGEEVLLGFLKNEQISVTEKEYVLDRTLYLLEESPTQYTRVKRYKHAFENKFSLDGIYTEVMYNFWKFRGKYSVLKQLNEMKKKLPIVDLEHMDFEAMLQLAELQGKTSCTNNDFGIEDDYWDANVKVCFEKGEIAEKKQVFTESPEYDDLKCFLRVTKELDIEVILVSIPVNSKWYTYWGQLCDEYYRKIEETAHEFDNVTFVDMSEYADEKYFLKDIMHLGWKGWVRIIEALYREFKS